LNAARAIFPAAWRRATRSPPERLRAAVSGGAAGFTIGAAAIVGA
jgi:hypothetical protein